MTSCVECFIGLTHFYYSSASDTQIWRKKQIWFVDQLVGAYFLVHPVCPLQLINNEYRLFIGLHSFWYSLSLSLCIRFYFRIRIACQHSGDMTTEILRYMCKMQRAFHIISDGNTTIGRMSDRLKCSVAAGKLKRQPWITFIFTDDDVRDKSRRRWRLVECFRCASADADVTWSHLRLLLPMLLLLLLLLLLKVSSTAQRSNRPTGWWRFVSLPDGTGLPGGVAAVATRAVPAVAGGRTGRSLPRGPEREGRTGVRRSATRV